MEFTRQANQTIMDGLVVRYKEVGAPGGLQISVSRNGIAINGNSPTMTGITDVVAVLERCEYWFNKMRTVHKALTSSSVDAIGIENEPECVVKTIRAVFVGENVVLEKRESEA